MAGGVVPVLEQATALTSTAASVTRRWTIPSGREGLAEANFEYPM